MKVLLGLVGIVAFGSAALVLGYFAYQAYLDWLLAGASPEEAR